MSYYNLLHQHDYFSLLDSCTKPWQNAKRAIQIGAKASAITNHGSISGCISHLKAIKDACGTCGCPSSQHIDGKGKSLTEKNCEVYTKNTLKSILGCEFYLCPEDPTIKTKENGLHSHLCVLAKNLNGWKSLIQAVSLSNSKDYFYKKPRLNLDKLSAFAKGDFIAFSGHPGSDLGNVIFTNPRLAYGARTYEDAKSFLKESSVLKRDLLELADRYKNIFGKDNFFLEIQLVDQDNLPASKLITTALRWLSKQENYPCVATPDAHYPEHHDAADQRVLLCAMVNTTLKEAQTKIENEEDFGLSGFFRSNNYHIPSFDEMKAIHTDEEINNTLAIGDMCEEYNVFSEPKLPQFKCPNDAKPEDYLLELCRNGWKEKIVGKIDASLHKEYADRVKYEHKIIADAGLSSYLLIVQDYVDYSVKQLKCPKPRGRGSASGSLVSYLIGIHNTNPILYDLSFERFINPGRLIPGKISLPDVDCDFPIDKRTLVYEYSKNKYGFNKVAQMATFGRMQGREALTSVLRAHEWGTFEERKKITLLIPDESKIADKLQEMREEEGEASILKWSLENLAKDLEDYAKIEEDGSITGPLSLFFKQAIRLEGSKRTRGKHAAGVIISPDIISELCPVFNDGDSDIALFEMGDCEAIGLVKFDFLGVACLSKISSTIRTIREGKIGSNS